MKRVTATMIALFSLISISKAQAPMRPEGGEMGLGFHASGLFNVAFGNWGNTGLSGQLIEDPLGIFAPGTTVDQIIPQQMLFGRYYLSSALALRVGLGINSTSQKTYTEDSLFAGVDPDDGIETDESKTSGFSFGLGAGIEKHFATSASRLDPYVGGMANIGMLGGFTNVTTNNEAYEDANLDNSSEFTSKISGGMSWGIDLIGGFNYFFSDHIAIGAEVSWGFGGLSMGGEYTVNGSITPPGGAATPITEVKGVAKTSMSGFRVGATNGVNLSIFW